jgi:flagellar hook protein FlgE
MYTGVSGLESFGSALQVIGNNIANVNTVGFKSSDTEFANLLSESINGSTNLNQMGQGVTVQQIATDFSQGSFSSTGNSTDMAIDGNGFFVAENAAGQQFYTRDGQFSINKNGQLVTATGLNVMGYQLTGNNNNLQNIVISQAITQAHPTGNGTTPAGSGVTIQANLNASDSIMNNFNAATPASTSNFSTSMTVYDSQGVGHTMEVYFNKTANNAWSWNATVDGGDLTGGTAGTPTVCASGTLSFNSSGALQTSTTTTSSFNFKGIATPQTIGFNFGTSIASGGTGLDGTTQFGTNDTVISQTQDGYTAGNLSSITIDQNGIINGSYSNGQTIPIAQIGLASFTSEAGLISSGSDLYSATVASGPPSINKAGQSGMGTITDGSLELSNVDLATEFVNLISTQQAYAANSKIITTGDELLSDIVNIIH